MQIKLAWVPLVLLGLSLAACNSERKTSEKPAPSEPQIAGSYRGIFKLTDEQSKDPNIQKTVLNAGNPKLDLKSDHTFKMESSYTLEGDWKAEGDSLILTANGRGADALKKQVVHFKIAADQKSLKQLNRDGTDGSLVFNRK